MARPHLTLIVPCFNEASRLRPGTFLDFTTAHPSVFVLFADDGSTDATAEVIGRLVATAPQSFGLIRLPARLGKAAAVRTGVLKGLEAQPELIGYWDADLSTPLSAVDDFLALAGKRPDVDLILGSRVNLLGKDVRRGPLRHYLGRVFATAVSEALDLPVYDTQCGAKVFRAEPAGRIFSEAFHCRWIFDVELLARYLALPVETGGQPRWRRIYELAVPAWRDEPGSKLRWFDFVRAMFDLVSIWRTRAGGA